MGMSRYFTIFGSSAKTSISSLVNFIGVQIVNPHPVNAIDPAQLTQKLR